MEYTQDQKMYAQIVKKAWEDATFKKDLVANPVNAIEQLGYKIDLPQGHTVIVNDQTSEAVTYINIPRQPQLDSLELTDEQLEMVNGGEFVVAIAIGGAFLTGMGVGVAIYAATHQKAE
ncbi:NHLP leader peptide family RiPP precursor [Spirosoma sp. RP8]|uniref:NHLP leader peptide family RiPP n=1 Tax=Spirosoma liriopis TaxID=2937440 RepID=A0ABT0HV09_9BACT|nr:NHLP leader peptide family RiPP precursor [Spirosoma liriopis]MCK8496020.1 NHLP leader peptide family RiPP precursor [Spirosoma liriopis]